MRILGMDTGVTLVMLSLAWGGIWSIAALALRGRATEKRKRR